MATETVRIYGHNHDIVCTKAQCKQNIYWLTKKAAIEQDSFRIGWMSVSWTKLQSGRQGFKVYNGLEYTEYFAPTVYAVVRALYKALR